MKAETQVTGMLSSILSAAAARVAALAPRRNELERLAARAPAPPSFRAALGRADVAIIAEVKRRSPSAGTIRADADAADLARVYAASGAAAISVLTEPTRFAGSLDDLARAAAAVALPVLRKDFIVDAIQLYEARAAGAAAVLLIVRALGAEQLGALARAARAIGLETLIEVHGAGEVETALAAGPDAVGVNARDLETLTMDPAGAEALLAEVPARLAAVAESGIAGRADVERLASRGADAVLVGTALAGAADPARALAALVGVGRRGRGGDR